MKKQQTWMGIDFGTCYSSAARLNGSEPVMIPVTNAPETGSTQRPTVAYISKNNEIKTGYAAEPYRFNDPERFFAEFKLEILDRDPLLPDSPVTHADLVTAILSDIKTDACKDNNNTPVHNAIITVPAIYLKDGPRWKIMKDAAYAAGFDTVELFHEPQAAALYYSHVSGETNDGLTLVYDLGGGTFDPALIQDAGADGKLIQAGNSGGIVCGGLSFDHEIFKDLRTRFSEAARAEEDGDFPKIAELYSVSRKVKHLLSGSRQAALPLPFDPDKEYTLSRTEFEKMISPLLDKTLNCCTNLLQSAKKEWKDLTRVLLVGGSTHIPLVRRKISDYLKMVGAEHVRITRTTIDSEIRVDPVCAVAAGAVTLKKETFNTMNPELYEKKRNELIEILDEVLAIDELREETKVEIEKTRTKALESNFEIVLVGEFQGGKSTTFNAICDGREISPRGAMIKTSACKISACNLADQEAEEYAQIAWKDDRELLLGMIKLIGPYLRKAQPDRFGQATQEQMVQHITPQELIADEDLVTEKKEVKPLKIKNSDDLKLIREALAEEWKVYKKHPDSYGQENIDVLYISSLIAHFIDTPEIEKLRETSKISVYEMGKLVTFPMDWDVKWQASTAEAFKAKEIAFAFVASVCCYIHSPNLARLGCVVTDCPGLFTSPWDTEVARRAMLDADAILYLFGGSKTLGQGDIRALNEIRKVKMEHKLVYAVNVKEKLKHIAKNIVPVNVAKLNAQGFEVSDSDLHLYHALLGLCSKNGLPIKNGDLDEYSTKRFVEVAQKIDEDFGDNAEEIWVELSDDMVSNVARRESINILDKDNVRKVSELSGLNDLFDGIEFAVVKKKAHAILVSQGAERASAALALLVGDLKSMEEAAKRTEVEFKVAVARARDDLDAFQAEVKTLLSKLEKQSLGLALADNFENVVVLENIQNIADSVTERIAEHLLSLDTVFKNMWQVVAGKVTGKQNKKIEDELKPIFDESIKDICGSALQGWLSNVKNGKNEIFNSTIGEEVENVSNSIEVAWDRNVSLQGDTHAGLLDGLEIQAPIGTIAENDDLFAKMNIEELKNKVNGAGGLVIAGGILGFAVGSITAVVSFVLSCYILIAIGLGFLPLLVPIIISFVAALAAGQSVSEAMKGTAGRQLKNKILEGLNSAFYDPKSKEKLRESSLQLVGGLQQIYVLYFEQSLDEQSQELEERIKISKKNFQLKEAERRELAETLNNLRTKKISPVRSKLGSFLKSVLGILDESKGAI